MTIDRDKIHSEARKLDGTGVRVWLGRAIELLPDDALPELIADYVHLRDVLVDENGCTDLLRSSGQFYRESLAGHYYENFNVNSRNCMETSRGTEVFIAEQRAVLAEPEGNLHRRR